MDAMEFSLENGITEQELVLLLQGKYKNLEIFSKERQEFITEKISEMKQKGILDFVDPSREKLDFVTPSSENTTTHTDNLNESPLANFINIAKSQIGIAES